MPSKLPTLANWFTIPGNAAALDGFLESATGKRWLETLAHHFRAAPDSTPIVLGVNYTEVHAYRNASREGVQAAIDLTRAMSIPHEKKERIPDSGWATQALRDESIITTPDPKPKKKK